MASKRDALGVKQLDYSDFRPGRNDKKNEVAEIETMDDVTAILRMAQTRLRASRTVETYPNTKQGLEAFKRGTDEFFSYIASENERLDGIKDARKLIPDIEGWACFLGISRQTILNYEKRGGEWADTIEYIKNTIASVKKQLAMCYKIPPMLSIFDMTNNHHYLNTSEYKLVASTEREREEIGLTDKLAGSGLVYDEISGEYLPAIEDKGEA